MFNTMEVGRKIMTLRKAKNLTQTSFADELGVRFQAVSNWERGNSMPDISKLADISRILDCTIDYLLGNSNETRVVKKIMDHDTKELNVTDIKSVAPIIEPEEVTELLEESTHNESDLKEVADLAAFVSTPYLEVVTDKLIDMKAYDAIEEMLPHLSSEYLVRIFELDGFNKEELYPFLSDKDLVRVCRRAMADDNVDEILEMLPFLNSKFIEEVAVWACDKDVDKDQFYPFLSTKSLQVMAEDFLARKDFTALADLAPFL